MKNLFSNKRIHYACIKGEENTNSQGSLNARFVFFSPKFEQKISHLMRNDNLFRIKCQLILLDRSLHQNYRFVFDCVYLHFQKTFNGELVCYLIVNSSVVRRNKCAFKMSDTRRGDTMSQFVIWMILVDISQNEISSMNETIFTLTNSNGSNDILKCDCVIFHNFVLHFNLLFWSSIGHGEKSMNNDRFEFDYSEWRMEYMESMDWMSLLGSNDCRWTEANTEL